MTNSKAKILLVDDEANIRLMLRTVLETEGYTITEAANGVAALAAMSRENFDLAILDLNMPQLDGMGVLHELSKAPPLHVPRIIVLTAYGSIGVAVKATRLGALDFMEKPITPDDLRITVASVLAQPEPDAPEVSWSRELEGGYAAVLNKVRKALRLVDTTTAETLLIKAADLAHNDAPYFNLLGVLYESRHQWRLARKFYGKAIRADKHYDPAQANMRRLYELETFGASTEPVTLGDEMTDVWYSKTPTAPSPFGRGLG